MEEAPKDRQKQPAKAPRASTIFLLGALLLGALLLSVFATTVFVLVFGEASISHEKHLIAERDSLYADILARSIAVYVETSQNVVETLADQAADVPLTSEALTPMVETFTNNNTEFWAMSVVDREGNIVAALLPNAATEAERHATGVSVTDREYFKEVLATRKTVISEAITSRVTPRPTVTIAAPMFDEQGNIIGMALGGLDLEALYSLAQKAIGSEFAVPVVTDHEGQIIVHHDDGLVASHRIMSDFAPAKRALAGESGFIEAFIDTDGVERSAAYTPISELGWAVWIAQDTAQYAEVYQQVGMASALWAMGIFVGVIGLFFILMHILITPFDALGRQAKQIIEDRTFEREVKSQGSVTTREVEAVADSFNDLLASVHRMKEEVEGAARAKSQFLTVATHAFRTPLTVSSWTLDSMIDQLPSYMASQQQDIRELYDANKRLGLGFENLFAALDIFERTARPQFVRTDLSQVVAGAAKKLQEFALSHNVRLQVNPDGPLESVVDVEMLDRITQVLVANAIVYNRVQGSVEVDLRQVEGMAALTVKDTGIGIAVEERMKVFEPFYRGERATKKYTDGTGLGLYIAKAFTELLGGSIEIESTESEGTLVTVRLPLRPVMST